MLLEGISPPLTTCFYPDGRPYWRKIEQNVERYSRSQVSGLVVLGSTGEAVMLGDDDSRETLRISRGAAFAEKVLIAGVGRESVCETLRLAEYAAQLGYDVVLVRTPHFYRPTMGDREILTFYQSVADHSPLPVLLDSIPVYTGYDMPVALAAELALHPNIIGIKESSGRVERTRMLVEATRNVKPRTVPVTPVFAAVTARMMAPLPQTAPSAAFIPAGGIRTGEPAISHPQPPPEPQEAKAPTLPTRTREIGFQVLCGKAQNLYDSLQVGASGGVIAAADFAPQAVHEIYTAWKDRDAALAIEKQQRLVVAENEICGRLGIPGLKHAMDWNGYFGGHPRMPLLPLTADQQQNVENLLTDLRN